MKKVLVTGGSGFIGTNLVSSLISDDIEILTIDVDDPKISDHYPYFKRVDIKDKQSVDEIFTNFKPDIVIHLAARTDLRGKKLKDYDSNTEGSRNIILCCNEINSVKKIIFCSSMLVCKLGYKPKTDLDFCPSTIYGESKANAEIILRKSISDSIDWTIIRPTSIWGPWFGDPYKGFFNMIRKNLFFLPKNINTKRSYGFIDNSVSQIKTLISNDESFFSKKIVYIHDYEPLGLSDWSVEISNQFGSKKIIEVPLFLLKLAAHLGDFMSILRIPFPINNFRLNNMLTEAVFEENLIQKKDEEAQITMEEGVKKTISWLLKEDS